MPMEHVELGKGHAINLLKDFFLGEKIAPRVNHDSADRVQRSIFDRNRGLDDELALAVADDDLLEGSERMERTINGLCGDLDGVGALSNC